MKYAIFGDLSGWREPFKAGLATVGVDLDGDEVPDDLTVIQVGDVIRKGPDSEQLMIDVNRLQLANPDNWVQLIGNHEAMYLGGPLFGPWEISKKTLKILRGMFYERRACAAVAIDTVEHGEILVTHAGMTPHVWGLFDKPKDIEVLVQNLNALAWSDNRLHQQLAFHPGRMLSGNHHNLPGVVWTETLYELWSAWEEAKEMPFSQVHGHAQTYNWGQKRFWMVDDAEYFDTEVDRKLRQVTAKIHGKVIIGIDPGYGEYDPGRPLLPLVLEAA